MKHPTADISPDAKIPDSASVWHYAQVREQVVMGENCIVGRGAYIGTGVKMGDNCKVQNYALVYEPAELADGVFIGPAVVLTNDEYPRSITPDGKLKSGHDWVAVGVTIKQGASIGARSVCVAPVTVGAWTLVAAGSVVTREVLEKNYGPLISQRVVVLGAAYRGGVKETAFSGVFETVEALKAKGADVLVHDPMFTDDELRECGFSPFHFGEKVNAAILQANHSEYRDLKESDLPGVRTVVDGRNFLRPGQLKNVNVVILGVAH